MIDASTENSVTYPEFVNRQDGSLVFSYRNGGSGDGVTYFNVYNEASSTWSRLVDEPLFDGNGSADNPSGTWNAYFENPTLGPDGWFHMIWVWRDTPDAATNSRLSYAKSRNLVDWFDSAGHALTTPFRYGEADVIDPVPDGGGLLNGNAKLGFDAEGTPIISYHKYDGDGNSQIYVARPDGSGAWDIHQISDWKGRWSFGGGGSLAFTVSMLGSEVMEDGNIRVDFTCSGEPRSIVIDGGLHPVAEASTPELPAEITDVRGTYPGLAVRLQTDLAGRNDTGTYYLRWESLPANQDSPRTDWPEEEARWRWCSWARRPRSRRRLLSAAPVLRGELRRTRPAERRQQHTHVCGLRTGPLCFQTWNTGSGRRPPCTAGTRQTQR